jgi:hypothetical protein
VAAPEERHGGARLSLPQVWRIPPWQPAALLLLTTGLGAVDIYGRPSTIPMIAAAFVAIAAFVAAVCAMRYLLVADEDGIWVRRVFTQKLVEWHDVARIETTARHRSGITVRIIRDDESYVDVPPSLVLPARPTTIPRAHSIVHRVARQLSELAAAQR